MPRLVEPGKCLYRNEVDPHGGTGHAERVVRLRD
jgi:hypothetical protein